MSDIAGLRDHLLQEDFTASLVPADRLDKLYLLAIVAACYLLGILFAGLLLVGLGRAYEHEQSLERAAPQHNVARRSETPLHLTSATELTSSETPRQPSAVTPQEAGAGRGVPSGYNASTSRHRSVSSASRYYAEVVKRQVALYNPEARSGANTRDTPDSSRRHQAGGSGPSGLKARQAMGSDDAWKFRRRGESPHRAALIPASRPAKGTERCSSALQRPLAVSRDGGVVLAMRYKKVWGLLPFKGTC